METSGKTIWQQACGDTNRNYAGICLNWDVVLNGPGYAGPYPDCVDRLKKDDWSSKKVTDLKRFAIDMKDGDIVVLRLGTTNILGVGVIIGEYEWLEEFSDIDGWDLQHVRRVRWLWKNKKNPKVFPTYTLKQGDTTQLLSSEVVTDWLESLKIKKPDLERNIAELPKVSENEVDLDQISEYLFDEGVSSNSIESLITEIGELIRIAKWYKKFSNPSEFETVAYLVVPLLRALGWTPQKMAIEWHNVDIALFSQLPRDDSNLNVVVEAKKKGNSCLSAKSQAQSYADGKKNCNRLIVTDGLRYGIYLKKNNEFKLHAYFNLTKLKSAYPVYGCNGIQEALRTMTPEWDG